MFIKLSLNGITSKFVKDTAKTLGTKALEASVNKVGSEIGTRAANKVISTVEKKFSKPPKEVIKVIEVESDDEDFSKFLGNIIIKELSKNIPESFVKTNNLIKQMLLLQNDTMVMVPQSLIRS